ncbi:hypothetical protein GCM10010492_77000 [Saccharothrix mutabilis subsp. mutabilis]|uniref:PPE domain-containing protein n=1 Tax=Saccharothrix mutabilis subsp. mutabilis TaxID=66855 RepID=A0ABN0UXJ0_9PSEU
MADQQEIDLVLTDAQNWASRSHRELYDAVHNNNDPGQTGEIGAEWGQFGTELTESARVINERVAASESGWTGEAADGARAAVKKLAEWVTQTAATAVEVGKRVQDQSVIMENARASMPEPVNFSWDQATGTFTQGGIQGLVTSAADVQAANDQARALHEHAVTVMTTMENESRAVDQTTPRFTPPYNPVTGRVEEPPAMMMATAGAPTLGDAQPAMAPSGGAAAGTTVAASAMAAPAAPAYTPAVTSSGVSAGSYGGAAGTPLAPAASHRPEGTTAAAAAAQVPVANKYTPPTYTPPSSGGGQNPPSYVPPSYVPPGSSGGKQQPPPYRPAPPGTVVPQAPGKYPPYVPAGTPGTPPVGSGPGGPGSGPGARPGMPGGFPGGFPGGGGGGGFGGGGGGGFGPTGSGGGGGQLAAGGSTGVVGQRGPMPGGFGPMAPGAGAASGMPMGGAPMGGAPAGGQGDEDKEHRSAAYLRGEDIFEVPGENLPPSVIGGAKPKKKGGEA